MPLKYLSVETILLKHASCIENKSFPIGSTEGFYFRKEEKLYFSAWYEDPDYRVEIIIRDFDTGEVIKKMPDSIRLMPDGQQWLLL